MVSKLTVPTLLSQFKFEFKDDVNPETVPYMHNNMSASKILEFKALISVRPQSYSLKA